MTLVERYLAGQSIEVWNELIDLGPDVRQPDMALQAKLVADETMRRARRNVEVLVRALPSVGWSFHYPVSGEPGFSVWSPADSHIEQSIGSMEARLNGPIPVSLAAWWRIVGAVDLTRKPAAGPFIEYPDPLVVLPPRAVLDELEEWQGDDIAQEMVPEFLAPIAPDLFHKEDVSGGAPYGIHLPDATADGVIRNLGDEPMHFVAYLRHAFKWAGLPGYAETHTAPPSPLDAVAASSSRVVTSAKQVRAHAILVRIRAPTIPKAGPCGRHHTRWPGVVEAGQTIDLRRRRHRMERAGLPENDPAPPYERRGLARGQQSHCRRRRAHPR